MTEEEKAARYIEACIAVGIIYQLDDGLYVYDGLYANNLRQVANKLDEMNAPLARQIEEDLTGMKHQHQGVTNEDQN